LTDGSKNKPSVAVISVAYNSIDEIPAMAASLPAWVTLKLVDNGPDDGLRKWASHNNVELLVPAQNLGFGEGCNQGAKLAPAADFYFFLNPDARLAPNTIDAFLGAAAQYLDASAFGPEIRKPNGKSVSLRPSKLIPTGHGQKRKSFPTQDTNVQSLSGAALFVRRGAFEKVGGFDAGIFMYFEDDDLTMRLAKQAGPLWYIPAAKVTHEGDKSSPPSPELAHFKGYHYARSQIYMLHKLGRGAPFLKGLTTALRRCISVKMLSSPTSRSYAIGRVSGAWSMRRSGT
jgi:N-acetylglucosaminyl-diphospho-decaprenol L-rhamnosyltransferase